MPALKLRTLSANLKAQNPKRTPKVKTQTAPLKDKTLSAHLKVKTLNAHVNSQSPKYPP